jgi:Bcl-2-related ovarian killer protein
VEGVADVIEDDLVHWINDNGGWIGLSNRVRPADAEFTLVQWTIFGILGICGLFLIVFIMKYVGIYFFPNLMNVT